jgi:hypothetical protein
MEKNLVNNILILIISIFFLSSTILADLCLAIEISTTKSCESPILNDEPEHSHDQNLPCRNTSCSNEYSCCNILIEYPDLNLFILSYHKLIPEQIFFQPLIMTTSLYHPPRSLL